MENIIRCDWARHGKLEQEYHDRKWGVPVHDDHELFKMLCMEGMQAGLSWSIILSKWNSLCEAFDDFLPEKLIHYDENKREELMGNPGVIRNRLKINSVIHNAKVWYSLVEKYGSLDAFMWGYVGGKPIRNAWTDTSQIPAVTELSDRISKDLKKEGFKFVGSTTIYAFMQAVGMVNDHLVHCSFYNRQAH